ncbi:hypothetical protein ACFYRD_22520 [Streptomyces hirsutus]|uniref:hypothetical protein n=1 Tax=Streptomyces hirsutus TaxID=35620 RepID=UPI003693872B
MDLLPVNSAALASDPRALQAVRAVGERYGVDYTDDTTVTELLTERRRALRAQQRGPVVWLAALTLTTGVIWPIVGHAVPAFAGKPVLAYAPAGPLLVVAVAMLTFVHVRWKRELTHPTLAGYRVALGVIRAHGIPLTYVPAWLEGRSSGGSGKGTAPIPSYPPVKPSTAEPLTTESAQADQLSTNMLDASGPVSSATVPPKPPAVTAYERLADAGGWHDEAGYLLVAAGSGGALWAWTSDVPIGYGALLLIPAALLVWLAGSRQGDEKHRLREEAVAYVRVVAAAQAAGAQVPELSPVLQELVDAD